MKPFRIIVLCVGNSCRSQMAEGFLKQEPSFEVFSAGTAPKGVDPKAIEVMREVGIDISGQTSNAIEEYKGQDFDFVVTLWNDQGKEECPFLPSSGKDLDMRVPEPGLTQGSEEQIMKAYREVRDLIKTYCSSIQRTWANGKKESL